MAVKKTTEKVGLKNYLRNLKLNSLTRIGIL